MIQMYYDFLIKGGNITDGTGRSAFVGDVAVINGKISAVGELAANGATAKRIIDATGYTVTPGFIDIHRHADAAAFRPGYGSLELHQGLTTIVNGNCGLSIAPVSEEHREEIKAYLRPITGLIGDDIPISSMEEYLDALHDMPINTGMLVGAGIARADAAGYVLEKVDDSHFSKIHKSLEKALSEGALGVSLGLGYSPECFYSTDELIRALEPVRNTDIPVTVHMRQEGSGVISSIREMLEVGKNLRCPVHISHLKAMGRDNWGRKIPEALEMIQRAREEGLDVTCDVYPYTAGSTQFMHILPPDYLTGGIDAVVKRLLDPAARHELDERINERHVVTSGAGANFDNIAKLAGWDGIFLTTVNSEKNKIYQGKNVAQIAQMRGSTPLDACCDLLAEERCQITMIDFMASEDDIISILKQPFANLISDATYPTEGQLHPRVYGTFTHMLEHLVREKGAFSLEHAVACMTGRAAAALRMKGKGIIEAGADADICVFKPEEIHENADYQNPSAESEGMEYVFVNGQLAMERNLLTQAKAGRVVRPGKENYR